MAKSVADALSVPAGYTATVLFRLGDPIAPSVAEYLNNGTDPAASYAQRAGDHHDGMQYFGMGSNGAYSANASDRGLLVQNHEAITPAFLHPNGQTIVGGVRTVTDEVFKEFYVHGVSVIEVNKAGSTVTVNRASSYNRRVHTLTPMTLSGPPRLRDGNAHRPMARARGYVNNAPRLHAWGTYLTCEENWGVIPPQRRDTIR